MSYNYNGMGAKCDSKYDTTLYMTENISSIFPIKTCNIKPTCLITIMGWGLNHR